MNGLFERIARAVERLAPKAPRRPDLALADAFVGHAEPEAFQPVAVPIALLKGIDVMRES